MSQQWKPALVLFVLLTIVTGVVYPLLVTVVAQTAFPDKANGSLVYRGTDVAGSSLIGQPFDDPKYYTRSFGFKTTATLQPDTDIIEYVCTENWKNRPH